MTSFLYKHVNHTEGVKVFMRCLGVIYFCSFLSFYHQWPGLYGDRGLLPVDTYCRNILNHFQCDIWSESNCIFDVVQKVPSIFLFSEYFHVPSDIFCNFILIISLLSSAALVQHKLNPFLTTLIIIICHINYLSIITIGQTFTTFQWDILLMEIGFLAIFVSLIECFNHLYKIMFQKSSNSINIGVYGLRFLAWKLMFSAGVVKLGANCPTWNALTALEYHFATQPLPTPLGWFAHQLPPILLRFGVATTLIIEIPLTYMLIWNSTIIRRVGVIFQILLQVFIMLTGNYNFFNLLTIVLMIPSWISDDFDVIDSGSRNTKETVASKVPLAVPTSKENPSLTIIKDWYYCCVILVLSCVYYVKLGWNANSDDVWETLNISLRNKYVDMQPYMLIASAAGIFLACSQSILDFILFLIIKVPHRSIPDAKRGVEGIELLKRVLQCAYTIVCHGASLCFVLFWISVASYPLREFSPIEVVLPGYVPRLSHSIQPYRIVSGYGLFRVMTGVGNMNTVINGDDNNYKIENMQEYGSLGLAPSIVARPELIIKALHPKTNSWHEIQFKHKPTSLYQVPTFVAPHQPRLDWQMWFAALGSYHNNAWLVQLVYKLLNDPSTDILNLLDRAQYELQFHNGTYPIEIKIFKYDYDFTRYESAWSRRIPGIKYVGVSNTTISTPRPHANATTTHAVTPWWYRRNKVEYFPGIRSDNPSLIQFLEGNGFNTGTRIKKSNDCQNPDMICDASSIEDMTSIFNNIYRKLKATKWFKVADIIKVILQCLMYATYAVRNIYKSVVHAGSVYIPYANGYDWLCCGPFPFLLLFLFVKLLNIFV